MTHTVIGGGLAGLTAAVELARSGAKVRLIEQHHELGGRAMTTVKDGFSLNLGPHALYLNGATHRTLTEWGILPSGTRPILKAGSYMVTGGVKHPMVRDVASLATCGFLSVLEKIEAGRMLTKLTGGAVGIGAGLTIAQWLGREVSSVAVRRFAETLIRVSTYCDASEQSAEAALQQIHMATGGVMYLDGGWQSMVRSLADYARSLSVTIETGTQAKAMEPNTILTGIPPEVEQLSGKKLPKLTPIRLAALDLALDRLPEDAAIFGLGMDEPLYYSLHSRWAKLGPEGGAVVHVGKYMGSRVSDAVADRAQPEHFADLLMPGWRKHVHYARFLPEMHVTHAVMGLDGRPDVDAVGIPGVRIAGDWVGPEGMLADAAVASGRRAAQSIQREA